MIGLEYILKLYNMSQAELADKLGIKKQNIYLWLSQRQAISKKHLPTLESIFKVPKEYFQKVLSDKDKATLQLFIKNGYFFDEQIDGNNMDEIQLALSVINSYNQKVVLTPICCFQFLQAEMDKQGIIHFKNGNSFNEVTINISNIQKISYEDEDENENNYKIQIHFKDNTSIIVMLNDKITVSQNDDLLIEVDVLIKLLKEGKYSKVEIKSNLGGDACLELQGLCEKVVIYDSCDNAEWINDRLITIYFIMFGDKTMPIEKSRLKVDLIEYEYDIRYIQELSYESCSVVEIELAEMPYTKFRIYIYS